MLSLRHSVSAQDFPAVLNLPGATAQQEKVILKEHFTAVQRVFICDANPEIILDYYSKLAGIQRWKTGNPGFRLITNPLRAVYMHEGMKITVTVAPDFASRRSICTVIVSTPASRSPAFFSSYMDTVRLMHPYAKIDSFDIQISGRRRKELITLRCSDPPAIFLATVADRLADNKWTSDAMLAEVLKTADGGLLRIFRKDNTILMIAAGSAASGGWEYNVMIDSYKTRRR